jgi:hypothetical protein
VIIMLFSFTALSSLAGKILARFLPAGLADELSRIIFQGIVPLLLTAWFVEDTAIIFTSELILTDQRVWTKGSPYAWILAHETPLTEVKSMSARRGAIYILLKSTKKVQVHVFPDGKNIVEALVQFSGKTGPD